MAFWNLGSRGVDAASQLQAIAKTQAVVEFDVNGKVAFANDNFLDLMGYRLDEVVGLHHSAFVTQEDQQDETYKAFWAALARGEYQAASFRRVTKGGREVWLHATYTPILGRNGDVVRIVKFATDITASKMKSLQDAGRTAAIHRSQAVIEFSMDGIILSANENFLTTMGYALSEIEGRHHRMFVEPGERESAEYERFWERLRSGSFSSAEYKRIGKHGKEIWILASYNPILDDHGRPLMVVKFATDITEAKMENANYSGQIAAISKSQAVIEFSMDGTILTANDNFLSAVGYSLAEIKGRNHSMFVHPAECNQPEYREFWDTLRRGEYISSEFKRIGKGGAEVWIHGAYNPILDLNGRPFKVVKFAVDTTQRVLARQKSEQVRDMMHSAAAGAEQLKSSVQEISVAMDRSHETTSAAAEEVANADQKSRRLSDAADSMEGIVAMISNITAQINLLALNATIEAARAGEAGRGFSVVASEVKNLAKQAKEATDQIDSEIAGINAISDEVAVSLNAINSSMQKVMDYVTSTTAAVREQTQVTETMSWSMKVAAAEAETIRF